MRFLVVISNLVINVMSRVAFIEAVVLFNLSDATTIF